MKELHIVAMALALGIVCNAADAADAKYDGTWKGTYSPVSTLSPKCTTETSKRTVTIKDGVAAMTTHASKDGHVRNYTGTVKGDALNMISDDNKVTYTGKFEGNRYKATTGSLNCAYALDLERVGN